MQVNTGPAAPEAKTVGPLTVVQAEYILFRAWESREAALTSGELLALGVERGRLYVETDAIQGMLSRGQLCLIAAEETAVRMSPQEGCGCVLLTISHEAAETLFADSLAENRIFCPHALPVVAAAAKVLRRSDSAPEEHSAAAYQMLMYLHQHGKPYEAASDCPLLVEAALGILEEEFATLDGIEEVADRLGVTSNHLIRQFTNYVGLSPGRYLKLRRLDYAKELLSQSDISVTLVAELSGFSGANYFAKAFRKETGMSPSEYAAAHKQAMRSQTKKQLDALYF